jgi:hypothetical protein
MLKGDFIETNTLLEFYQNQIFPNKFPLLKSIFTLSLDCVYLEYIFWGSSLRPIPPYLTSFLKVLKTLSFCELYRGIFFGVK